MNFESIALAPRRNSIPSRQASRANFTAPCVCFRYFRIFRFLAHFVNHSWRMRYEIRVHYSNRACECDDSRFQIPESGYCVGAISDCERYTSHFYPCDSQLHSGHVHRGVSAYRRQGLDSASEADDKRVARCFSKCAIVRFRTLSPGSRECADSIRRCRSTQSASPSLLWG